MCTKRCLYCWKRGGKTGIGENVEPFSFHCGFFIKNRICTVSLSLCVSIKAEYSSSRSFDEAMVLSCHTGAAIAAGRGGGRGS